MQESVIYEWTRSGDPRELLERLNEFPEDVWSMVQENAIESIARTLPEEALVQTQALQDATVRNRLENTIVNAWAEKDVSAALAWVRSEPTVEYKKTLLMADILSSLAGKNIDLGLGNGFGGAGRTNTALDSKLRSFVDLCRCRRSPDVAQELLKKMRNEQTKLRGNASLSALNSCEWAMRRTLRKLGTCLNFSSPTKTNIATCGLWFSAGRLMDESKSSTGASISFPLESSSGMPRKC